MWVRVLKTIGQTFKEMTFFTCSCYIGNNGGHNRQCLIYQVPENDISSLWILALRIWGCVVYSSTLEDYLYWTSVSPVDLDSINIDTKNFSTFLAHWPSGGNERIQSCAAESCRQKSGVDSTFSGVAPQQWAEVKEIGLELELECTPQPQWAKAKYRWDWSRSGPQI